MFTFYNSEFESVSDDSKLKSYILLTIHLYQQLVESLFLFGIGET